MLDKIKVYRRSDAQEIDLETVRIGFGESLWLFVGADSSPTEQKLQLTKTDPLNKVKKEIEGWWFCEEYVVAENNTAIKCDYYNYINEKYVEGDGRGKSQAAIDISYSEIVFVNRGFIPKYLDRWDLNEPHFDLTGGRYSVDELDSLQAQIRLRKAEWTEMVLTKANPQYLAFEKFVSDLGMLVKHCEDYEFSYQSIGEDKYIKLLELINQ